MRDIPVTARASIFLSATAEVVGSVQNATRSFTTICATFPRFASISELEVDLGLGYNFLSISIMIGLTIRLCIPSFGVHMSISLDCKQYSHGLLIGSESSDRIFLLIKPIKLLSLSPSNVLLGLVSQSNPYWSLRATHHLFKALPNHICALAAYCAIPTLTSRLGLGAPPYLRSYTAAF